MYFLSICHFTFYIVLYKQLEATPGLYLYTNPSHHLCSPSWHKHVKVKTQANLKHQFLHRSSVPDPPPPRMVIFLSGLFESCRLPEELLYTIKSLEINPEQSL